MSQINVITTEGKTLTRTRVRAQRLVDAGTHRWKDRRTVEELVPESSHRDPCRFFVTVQPVFEYDYPIQPNREKDPHFLPYTYPLPIDILRHYQS